MDGGDLWFTLVSNTYKYKYSLLPRLSMDCRMILRQLDCYYCYVKQIYPKSVLFRWKTTFAHIFFLLLSANTPTSGFPPQKRQKDLDWSFLIVFTIIRQWIFRVSTVLLLKWLCTVDTDDSWRILVCLLPPRTAGLFSTTTTFNVGWAVDLSRAKHSKSHSPGWCPPRICWHKIWVIPESEK